MLTQEPAPDTKFKLNILSFFTGLHPLDCFICDKDIIIIVLLLQMMGNEKVWIGWFVLGF